MTTALTLIRHVWEKNHTTAYEALNHCMWDAVKLAVGAKLEWDKSDFAYIENHFRPGYWLGEHGWDRPYSLAVSTDGNSFIKAFEAWSGRKPFIANQTEGRDCGGYAHADRSNRKRGRIALWTNVFIEGMRYECTSITDDRVVLVSRPFDTKQKRKIRKLTHADCAELWPAPKKIPPTKPPKGWVTRQTSIDAGNCKHGTDAFIQTKVTPYLASRATVGDLSGAAISVKALLEIDPVIARQIARKAAA